MKRNKWSQQEGERKGELACHLEFSLAQPLSPICKASNFQVEDFAIRDDRFSVPETNKELLMNNVDDWNSWCFSVVDAFRVATWLVVVFVRSAALQIYKKKRLRFESALLFTHKDSAEALAKVNFCLSRCRGQWEVNRRRIFLCCSPSFHVKRNLLLA